MSVWWLRCLSRLIPRRRRDIWLREWNAELTYRRTRSRSGRGSWIPPLEDALGLRLRAFARWRVFSPGRAPKAPTASRLAAFLIDLRHAVRGLRRNPGPVLLSALSLSLAIGATATMLSVVDAIDLRPLPYHEPERLVQLEQVSTRDGDTSRLPASPDLFRQWVQRTRSYEALGAASPIAAAIEDENTVLGASRVTETFFPALGATPLLGRAFTAEEVREAAPALVISHQLWRTRFGGDPGIVGRTVSLSWAGEFRGVAAAPFIIVGVLPQGVHYPRGSDVWLPASGGFGGPGLNPMLTVVGRLRLGVSVADARAEIEAVGERLAIEDPDAYGNLTGIVGTLREAIQSQASQRGTSARFVLLLVAAFVLTLATINVAIVFLVRAARNDRDLLVRAALGAPRGRLLTLTLGQSVSASIAAGACGVLLSTWGIRLADARLSVSASGFAPVLDGRVVAAALLLSLAAGLASGLLAATRLRRLELHGSLGARASGRTLGTAGRHVQGVLIVAQVACSLVLLHGSAVLARDFVSLMTRETGFDGDRLIVAGLQLMATNTDAAEAADRIAALPGIDGAALGGLPAEGYSYRLEGGDALTDTRRPFGYRVSAGYLRTLGIPLLAGREFAPSDRAGSAPVAIVSKMAAEALWPGATPIGKRLMMENTDGVGEWVTVVGMSADERVDRDVRSPVLPILYRPWGQLTSERRRIEIFARAAGEPGALVPQIRSILRETRAGEGWQGDYVVTMSTILGGGLDLQRFRTSALLLFSAFALILASMGLYGVVATVVNQRTPEIGIRMALGARPVDALSLVARGGIGLALTGVALGLAGAVAAHGLLDSLVVDNAGFDLSVLVWATAFLIAAVGAATYLPGRRAARIDPALSLRE